ncbi:unnamed protein product [Citrullus colocynthis]|uniref:Uncharacterized protein n=1 Tax=Citrullus colocynthis TaxID=252529 RepID=A0ABP0YI93_9ROSI
MGKNLGGGGTIGLAAVVRGGDAVVGLGAALRGAMDNPVRSSVWTGFCTPLGWAGLAGLWTSAREAALPLSYVVGLHHLQRWWSSPLVSGVRLQRLKSKKIN